MGVPGAGPFGRSVVEPVQQTDVGCLMEGARRVEITAQGCTFGVQASRSRALPWLRVIRLPRLGYGVSQDALRGAVSELRAVADRGGVLRAHLEAWSPDPAVLRLLADACREEGFREVRHPRSYRDTVWLDLSGSEAEILARFHKTARANIRAPGKRGLVVRPITDEDLAPRLRSLHDAAFARTGAAPPRLDWEAVVGASRARPERVRAVGLFDPGADRDWPLGFAVAFCHGDVAEYAFAGSVRKMGMNIPLLYAPTWELMRWARECGARWWDFGGVTPPGVVDTRSGIAGFKRYFSEAVTRVGSEWVYEPSPVWARVARVVSGLGGRIPGA